MKNNLDNVIIFFFIFLILVFKIYFVIISPIPEGGTVFLTNSFLFFNFKGFLIDPSSFNDWNHIGTPIYYIYSLINLLFSGQLADNYKFFINASHVFISLLYILAITFFVKSLKKTLELKYIFVVLVFFFSSFSQIQSLESVDPHSFQGPLVLILVSFFISIFFKKKKPSFFKLTLLCFIFLVATSIKTSFLPFFIAFYIALIFFVFQNSKSIKFFLIFNLLIILIILFINLPIAGRLSVILYNVLFSRNDVAFNILSAIDLVNIFIKIGIKENIFYLILILINIFLFSKFVIVDNIIKFFKKDKDLEKSIYVVIIFSTLVFFSYLHLVLAASQDYINSNNNNLLGVVFRHAYIYSIFIIFAFLFYKTRNIFFEKLYICLVIMAFLFSIIFYINSRNSYKSELNEREVLFQTYLYSKIKNDGIVAVFNNSLGYGFASENNFYRANNIIQNDRFSEFVYKQHPKIRYLRLHDFLWSQKHVSQKTFQEKNNDFKKKLMLRWDSFLKDHLPNKVLYKFFSYNSSALSGNHLYPSKFRSKNLFLKKENEKISYAVFSYSALFKEFNITPEEFIALVGENYKVLVFESFQIKGDKWFLINFAQ